MSRAPWGLAVQLYAALALGLGFGALFALLVASPLSAIIQGAVATLCAWRALTLHHRRPT